MLMSLVQLKTTDLDQFEPFFGDGFNFHKYTVVVKTGRMNWIVGRKIKVFNSSLTVCPLS